MSSSLPQQPWWTDADDAELDVLVDAFLQGLWRHKPACAACDTGQLCASSVAALEVVLSWRRSRVLRSQAAWLRAQEAAREWLADTQLAARAAA